MHDVTVYTIGSNIASFRVSYGRIAVGSPIEWREKLLMSTHLFCLHTHSLDNA